MPRIYVADLEAYNSGRLVGAWIDLDGLEDRSSILDMIQASIREDRERAGLPPNDDAEWAVHDSEDLPDWFGECPDLEELAEYVRGYEEHGEPYRVWCDNAQGNVSVRQFEECYLGTFDAVEDYVEQTTRDCSEIPDFLEYYINWEAMALDWIAGGEIWVEDARSGEVYVYRNY